MSNINLESWLNEQDIPPMAAQPDPSAGQAPAGNPDMQQPNPADPNVANQMNQNTQQPQPQTQQPDQTPQEKQAPKPDVTADPQAPDMQDQQTSPDFEVWKHKYLGESVKGDTETLRNMLLQVRDMDLHPYARKFVDDNWNIQLIRENANVEKASKEIRRLIKQQLDRNNPATSVVNHLAAVLETVPVLSPIFIKLNGYGGMKSELHRQYLAALLGAVQVGNGGNKEDLIYNQRDYSILISTRYNARWGDVMLGSWCLKEDDPERYLAEPEVKRMQEGSPMERDALRRRVVVESIADQFETRAYVIHVADDDGTIYTLGWDIANSLRSAFTDGKLLVKTRASENSEAMIDDDGNIVPLVDLSIAYLKETGMQTDEGKPETKEYIFMERRNGMLFLSADLRLIKEASSVIPGMSFKETPYRGNPSDLKTLKRCVYSAHDMLMRQC